MYPAFSVGSLSCAVEDLAGWDWEFLDEKLILVVLCNAFSTRVRKIAHTLASITFGETNELPVAWKAASIDLRLLVSYAGDYKNSPGNRITTVTRDGDHLLVKQPDEFSARLVFPGSESEFFLKFDDGKLCRRARERPDGDVQQSGCRVPAPPSDQPRFPRRLLERYPESIARRWPLNTLEEPSPRCDRAGSER